MSPTAPPPPAAQPPAWVAPGPHRPEAEANSPAFRRLWGLRPDEVVDIGIRVGRGYEQGFELTAGQIDAAQKKRAGWEAGSNLFLNWEKK